MITLRKLEGLPERTRGRKLLALLGQVHDPAYDAGLMRLTLSLLGSDPQTLVPPVPPTSRERALIRHRLSVRLGIETADWDLQAPPDRAVAVTKFPFYAWLDDLRSPFNVGSIVRSAEAYGFSAVWHSADTPGLEHPRTRRTAMGAEEDLEVSSLSLDQMKELWGPRPVFALELGGAEVSRFPFPSEGLVLVGGEELGLSPEALSWADQSAGRVTLPLFGRKASLNVGVAFGVLAAAWTSHKTLSPPGDQPDAWT